MMPIEFVITHTQILVLHLQLKTYTHKGKWVGSRQKYETKFGQQVNSGHVDLEVIKVTDEFKEKIASFGKYIENRKFSSEI